MSVDERDALLGEVLDGAARSVEPEHRLPAVFRGGSRRRAVLWTSITAALAVFVGGVTWGALELRSVTAPYVTEVGGNRDLYRGPSGNWQIQFPRSWHVTTIGQNCSLGGFSGGVVLSSVDFRFRHPSGALGQCDGRFVMARFPRHAVALALQPMGVVGGIMVPEPDTAFPLGLSNLIRERGIRGGPDESYVMIWLHGQPLYRLGVWFGRDTSLREHDILLRVVESIGFTGAPRWVEYRDRSVGISLQRPSNWFVSRAVLNSNPNSGPVPEPLLVMASYRPALGGPDCGRLPSGIRRLGFVNAIAVITELPGSSGPPRPDGFSPRTSVASDRSAFCPGARQPFGSWTFRFSEAGRSFRIDVASGTGDAGEVRNVIWRILNGLRIQPR